MDRLHVRHLTIDELRDTALALGEPEYRYRQLATSLYARLAGDFDGMTDLPRALRATLRERFFVSAARTTAVQSSGLDGTRKYLLELVDGARIESVLMRYERRATICVSTQVGCPLDCVFCETAKGRFRRNLTAGEILDQICTLKADADLASEKVNIVFMGMGEPLLNLDEVVRAIRTLNHPLGLNLGEKRITVSTSSFPDRIRALADSGVACSLALSLNAPTDEKRREIMPKASRFSIAELLDAARYFVRAGRRRVTLEYVLLAGVNTSDEDADALARLARSQPFKLNLIPYNPGRSGGFAPVDEGSIERFVRRLLPSAPAVTVRRSRGADIDAACGQLWTNSLGQGEKAAGATGEDAPSTST
jgi:23S rRNA (adenine2503-C2)-methyltransferase